MTLRPALAGALLALGALSAPASAATVSVVDESLLTRNDTLAAARFRVDRGNFDQIIAPGGVPTPSAPQNNLGNVGALTDEDFSFTAEFVTTTKTLIWTIDGDSIAASTLELDGIGAFNALLFWAAADAQGSLSNSIDVTNVAIGGGITGPAIADISLTDDSTQIYLASSHDLSTFDWMVSGDVRFQSEGGNPSERLKVELKLKDVNVVPLPLGGWLLLGGFGAWFGAGRALRRA